MSSCARLLERVSMRFGTKGRGARTEYSRACYGEAAPCWAAGIVEERSGWMAACDGGSFKAAWMVDDGVDGRRLNFAHALNAKTPQAKVRPRACGSHGTERRPWMSCNRPPHAKQESKGSFIRLMG